MVCIVDIPRFSVQCFLTEFCRTIVDDPARVDYAVVAVPSTVPSAIRQRLRATFATLGVKRCLVVSDTVALIHAAALTHRLFAPAQYVVLDVGRAKTTATVVAIDTPTHVTVLATRTADVGGANIDRSLYHAPFDVRESDGTPVTDSAVLDKVGFWADTEALKRAFSDGLEEFTERGSAKGVPIVWTLTREAFLQTIQPDLDAIEALLKETLALAQRRSGAPTTLFTLHGRTSLLPSFPAMTHRLGLEPFLVADPGEGVVEGCCRIAEVNTGTYHASDLVSSLRIAQYVDAGAFELVLGDGSSTETLPFPESDTLAERSELCVQLPRPKEDGRSVVVRHKGDPLIRLTSPRSLSGLHLTCGLAELLYSGPVPAGSPAGSPQTAWLRLSAARDARGPAVSSASVGMDAPSESLAAVSDGVAVLRKVNAQLAAVKKHKREIWELRRAMRAERLDTPRFLLDPDFHLSLDVEWMQNIADDLREKLESHRREKAAR